jgi:hypothetical protein
MGDLRSEVLLIERADLYSEEGNNSDVEDGGELGED